MKGQSISMLLCSGVNTFHLRVSGRRGEVDLKRRLCFGFSYLPKTMLLFVVCHLARLFLRRWWWGRQLQLEDAPYSSVMTSANSNITRSGLPLKEKTSFLLNNKKNNHLRQITLRLSFFSHHACEKSNTLQRPPLLSPSLSCEVLSFVSLRDPVVKILSDLLRLVQNSWWDDLKNLWEVLGWFSQEFLQLECSQYSPRLSFWLLKIREKYIPKTPM